MFLHHQWHEAIVQYVGQGAKFGEKISLFSGAIAEDVENVLRLIRDLDLTRNK